METMAALGAVGMVGTALLFVALRHVQWDLIPSSAMPRVRWWQRHAITVLWACVAVTTVCTGALLVG